MDYNLWRKQHQSEHLPSAKIPKLFFDPSVSASAATLPLFVPEPYNLLQIPNLSVTPDHSTLSTSRFAKIGCFFSLAQWQELELQALIFKYMLAGATVPAELIKSVKNGLNGSSQPCYLQHPFQHFQHSHHPAESEVFQSVGGYWGKGCVDAEPGRCRRTDGKKWRCSRDVVNGHKYCERHMHRGRNRSRKHVEFPTTEAVAANVGGFKTANSILHSGSPPEMDLLQLNQRPLESELGENGGLGATKHQGQVLRHFFDDSPKMQQKSIASSPAASSSTNFFLKLSTGQRRTPASEEEDHNSETDHQTLRLSWDAGWNTNPASSMGGPLAEVLRSSSNSGSPISVLHEQLSCGSRSQISTSSGSTR